MISWVRRWMVFLLPFSCFSSFAQSGPEALSALEVLEKAERYRAERQARARPLSMAVPVPDLLSSEDAVLVLVSTVDHPVDFDAFHLSRSGEEKALGRWQLEARSHLWLPVHELMGLQTWPPLPGTLVFDLFGDGDTMQGWLVVRRSDHAMEIPLQVIGEEGGTDRVAFWAASSGNSVVQLTCTHLGNGPLRLQVNWGGERGESDEPETWTLGPGEQRSLRPEAGAVWARIQAEGDVEGLVTVGWSESPSGRQLIPFAEVGPLGSAENTSFHAIAVPRPSEAAVTLFNPSSRPLAAELSLQHEVTGDVEQSAARAVPPWNLLTLPLRSLFSLRGTESGMRLSIHGDKAFLVSGFSSETGDAPFALTFFSVDAAHANGTYPLLALGEYDVMTTLINLGEETARIGGHVVWDGGEHSLEVIKIPPGASHRIDFREIAEAAEPDLLSRTLDPRYRSGFFQWTSLGGSGELIARTEARSRSDGGIVGFNCEGCCEEFEYLTTTPSQISVGPGQNPGFQASVMVENCTGHAGPFPTTPIWFGPRSPFQWDGTNVSSSAGADRDLVFEGFVLETDDNCFPRFYRRRGDGRVKGCKKFCNPQCYSTSGEQTCAAQTRSCTLCFSCCIDLYATSVCKREDLRTSARGFDLCGFNCVFDKGCTSSPPLPTFLPCMDGV